MEKYASAKQQLLETEYVLTSDTPVGQVALETDIQLTHGL